MKWKPYPAYKESGVEWLGKVPKHWTLARLSRVLLLIRNGTSQNQVDWADGLKMVTRIETISDGRVNLEKVGFVEANLDLDRYRLQRGDILFSNINSLAMVGHCALVDNNDELYAGMNLLQLRFSCESDSRFAFYQLRSKGFRNTVEAFAKPAINQASIPASTLKGLPFLNPPVSEQIAVSKFLDRETAKIDTLISKQEHLIELLQEKRQALISHAVTKGLNPDAPMKPSGVEWLGEVPAHWVPTRIKFALLGITDTEHKTAPFYPDAKFLVVRTTNIKSGRLVLDDAKYTDEAGFKEWTARGVPQPGDIMFTREAPAGEACIVPEGLDLCLGQRVVLLHVDSSHLNSRFGLWSVYGGLSSQFIALLSQGSTVAHFNIPDIGNIPLLMPPLEEQAAVADFLDVQTQKLDGMCAKASSAIALMREHRTALISAAVTGKIDVRNHAHPLDELPDA